MSLQEIEVAIIRLSSEERLKLTDWFTEQYDDEWDKQIEADAKAGRLRALVDKAKEQNHQGLTRLL